MAIDTFVPAVTYQWPDDIIALARSNPVDTVYGEAREASTARDCPNCGGLGVMTAFVIADSHPDHVSVVTSVINGRAQRGYRVSSACPVCQGDQRAAWLERECGLVGDDLRIRLESFRPLDGKAAARRAAGELLALAPNGAGWASFYGGYGRGKSHLLKALVNGYRLAGAAAIYTTMADVLASVRSTFGSDAADAGEMLIRRYRHVRMLAIDEVDRVNLTSWAAETAFRLLNDRYTRRDLVLTVLATNRDPAGMPAELEYLGSRMSGGTMVELAGDDMRPVMG